MCVWEGGGGGAGGGTCKTRKRKKRIKYNAPPARFLLHDHVADHFFTGTHG